MAMDLRTRPGQTGGPAPPARPSAVWALVAVVVGILAFVGLGRITDLLPDIRLPFTSESTDRTGPAVLQALEDISEYRAASGHFQIVVDIEDGTRFVPSLIRGERTVFLAVGSVDAAVDFSGLSGDAVEVSDDRRSVTVRVPEPQLLDPELDPERSYVIDRDRGLLDRIGAVFSDNPTSERRVMQLARERLAEAARETDLRDQAADNTRSMLTGLLRSLGFTDVNVELVERPRS